MAPDIARPDGVPAPRLVVRHFARWSTALTIRWRAELGLDLAELMILHVALSTNIAHLAGNQIGVLAADDLRRPVSLMAVAQSMGLPYETVRRNAADLAGRGLFARVDGGWIVPRSVLAARPGSELVGGAADTVRGLIAELAALGVASAARIDPARLASLPDDLLARHFIYALVLVSEPLVATLGDLANGHIHATIVVANVEHIAADPILSRRFGQMETLPPDDVRKPVGLRELARMLGLPYPTVRRRVALLVERGFAELRNGGVIVPARVLEGETFVRNNLKMLGHLDAMFANLARF